MRGMGIAWAPLPPPPPAHRLGGEGRSVARGADGNAAPVGREIVHAVRDGHAISQGTKVVVVHIDGRLAPNPAGVFESTKQFALLAIEADERRPRLGETPPLAREVAPCVAARLLSRCWSPAWIKRRRSRTNPHRAG